MNEIFNEPDYTEDKDGLTFKSINECSSALGTSNLSVDTHDLN